MEITLRTERRVLMEMSDVEAVKIRDALKAARVAIGRLPMGLVQDKLVNSGVIDVLLGLETGLANELD